MSDIEKVRKSRLPKDLEKRIIEIVNEDLKELGPNLLFKNFKNVLGPFYVVIVLSTILVLLGIIFFTPLNLIFLLFPFAAVFLSHRYWSKAKSDLEKEIISTDISESEITRIIDKYSGIIDGIGTALPLIGAAVLLGIVSIKFPDDEVKDLWFIKIAIPFELMSILMLAAAKLFEPAFDQLAVIFQNIMDHLKREEKQYYHEQVLSGSKPITIDEIINKIDKNGVISIKSELEEIKGIIEGFANENTSKSLENLAKIISVTSGINVSKDRSNDSI